VQEINEFVSQNDLPPSEKLKWRVMKHNYINSLSICKHIEDKELHTPKGILVRTGVIVWAVAIVLIISTIVMYIPQAVEYLTP
jgi:hypothetical protein